MWVWMPNEFKGAIDGALKTAKPKGTRRQEPIERARLARETFSEVTEADTHTPNDIIAAYLLGDSRVKEVQKMEAGGEIEQGSESESENEGEGQAKEVEEREDCDESL